jgi:subtilase family serine protease
MTVAIVDAYDLPTAESDLAVYRSQYGLPPCTTANLCFRKVNQRGVTGSYPVANANWGQEIALDIDMVSAACPNCKILLVEADSDSFLDLGAAVNTAVAMGAIAVSNSYGGAEGSASSEAYLDANFYNHPGVAITASTGDCGYNCSGSGSGVQYPAASPYVVAVGGTRLTRDGSARGWTESAWGNAATHAGAGSGCSLYESKPSWQHDAGCAKRTQADVSAVADPATGVAVYVTGVWQVFGGTSAASPIIAATLPWPVVRQQDRIQRATSTHIQAT